MSVQEFASLLKMDAELMCINMLLRPETGHSVKEHMLLEKGNKLIPKFPVVKLHADQLIVLERKSGDSDSE